MSNNYNSVPSAIKITGVVGSDIEILDQLKVRESIKRRLSIATDDEYNTQKEKGFKGMLFDIFLSGTRVSVNNIPYDEGELVEDAVYSIDARNFTGIKSIRLESGVEFIFKYSIE